MKRKLLALLSAFLVSGCSPHVPLPTSQPKPQQAQQTKQQAEHRAQVLNLAGEENKQVTSVMLEGEFSEMPVLNTSMDVMHMGVVGLVGCPIEINSSELTSAKLQFKYDKFRLGSIPPENLVVLHYDGNSGFYDTVPSVPDTNQCTVSADISEDGVYMLADNYEWGSVWGNTGTAKPHPIDYVNNEYGFSFALPEGMRVEYIMDYMKDDEDGSYKVLTRSAEKGDLNIGVEYLLRPDSASAEEYLNVLADRAAANGRMIERGVINAGRGTKGYYFYADLGDTSIGEALSVNCMYEYSPHEYINFWYGFTDETEFSKVKTSLESFTFLEQR